MSASETHRDRLTIEIEPALRRRIEVAASLKGRSVREYVEEILTRAVAPDDPVPDGREPNATPIQVPPMTEEERQRAPRTLDNIERHEGVRTVRQGERIHVPPKTEEERARDLEAIAEVKRMRLELAEKHGRFEPEGWVLINEARKERTRQLMEASGMGWTEEDEGAWDHEE